MRITSEQDLDEIKLDVAELDKKLPKHASIDLRIRYSAGYYYHPKNGGINIRTPRSGFYFITADGNSPAKQAWTQGEALESRIKILVSMS